jgi:hypothetical protein
MKLVFLVWIMAACGTEDPTAHGACESSDPPAHCQRYLPMLEGAFWDYSVEEPGTGRVLGNKRNCIESREQIPGCGGKGMGFKMRRQEDNGFSYRWQSEIETEDGGVEVRFEYDQWFDEEGEWLYDVCFDDFRLRSFENTSRMPFLDVHTESIFHRTEPATEEPKSYEWRVVRTDGTVTVPAGTFTDCLVLSRSKTETLIEGEPPITVTKQYWFAKGVGKVYEVSVEEEEFLLDWRIPRTAADCPTPSDL